MIWDDNLKWSWRAGDTISPAFSSFNKMKKHFFANKPNSEDTTCVFIGDKMWAFYDHDFNQIEAPNSLVNKYFYGAMV